MENLDGIVFYAIDKAIRSYRQFAQQEIRNAGFEITIDQWLIIKAILENPGLPQNKIGEFVFKDNASVTRIIKNLERDGFISRKEHELDRRRTTLKVSSKGLKIIDDVQEVVFRNRAKALEGLSSNEIDEIKRLMNTIFENTSKKK